MKKTFVVKAFSVALAFTIQAGAVYALPTLQLDIDGGTYVGVPEESTIANSQSFDLIALFDAPNGANSLAADDPTFYISIALTPITDSAAILGSFVFNGVTIDATSDMTFGTPTIETVVDPLASHSIYETFFKEIAFQFTGDPSVAAYNVKDDVSSSGTLLSHTFRVDTTNLDSSVALHFDLYHVSSVTRGGTTAEEIDTFAPFSHDARSMFGGGGGGGIPDVNVPEPATLALLALGLLGISVARRRS